MDTTNEALGMLLNEVRDQCDSFLSRLAERMSARIESLYVEKDLYPTRDCPISASLALANPAHGSIPEMESEDMAHIEISFCREEEGFSVTALVFKDIVFAQLQQGPIFTRPQSEQAKKEARLVIEELETLVNQSEEKIYPLLR